LYFIQSILFKRESTAECDSIGVTCVITKNLGLSDEVYLDFFQEDIAKMVVETQQLNLIIFDPEKVEVVKWIE